MNALGYLLKAIAVIAGTFAAATIGHAIDNGFPDSTEMWTAIAVGLGAAISGVLGHHWHTPAQSTPDHTAVRAFTPRGDDWLPHEQWREFPDPIPVAPTNFTRLNTDIPDSDVPPDETLRRLWLVRARLAPYLNTPVARERYTSGRSLISTSVLVLVWVGFLIVALSPDDNPDDSSTLAGLFGAVFLLWPLTALLRKVIKAFTGDTRRVKALIREEEHLAGLDQQRQGGPLGGESLTTIRKNLPVADRVHDRSHAIYTPPEIPRNRL